MKHIIVFTCQMLSLLALCMIFGVTVGYAIERLSPEWFGAFVVLFALLSVAHIIFWMEE